MARTVEVELRLDSQGAVQRIEAGGQAFERLSDASDEASESLDRNEQAQREAGQAAERQASANREAAQAAERNETAQREAAQAAQRYAASTDRMAGAAGSANEVIFSTGDAIQDVQFGMAGAANNIAFVAENLVQMRQQGSGSTSVMQRLSGALMGPAGAILALQTLIALGPQIVSFFQSMSEGADSAIDSMEGLRNQMAEVLSLGELDDLGTNVSAIESQIGQLEGALQKLQQREQELADESETAVERTALSVQESIADFARSQGMSEEMVQQLGLAEGEAAERANEAATAQEELQVAIGEVNSRLQALRGRLRAIRAVEDVTPGLVTQNAGDAATNLLSRVREVQEISGEGPQLAMPEPEVPVPEQLAPDRMTLLERINRDLEQADFNSIRRINDALGRLDTRFKDAVSDQQRQRIQRLRKELRGLRKDMQSAGEEAGNLQQVGTTMGQAIASTLLSAENAAQRLGQALAGIAIRLAIQQIGGFGGGLAGGILQGLTGAPTRQSGGPVQAGRLYETHGLGDREFFVPSVDGVVRTERQMASSDTDVSGVEARLDRLTAVLKQKPTGITEEAVYGSNNRQVNKRSKLS